MKLTPSNSTRRRALHGAVIGVLGIVAAQRDQVWANDIAYRETIHNTDFAAAGVGGLRNLGRGTIILKGMTGEVSRAYLYWAGPLNSSNTLANAYITVNNRAVTGTFIGFSDDNCWGYERGAAYRADVTSLVAATGNGNYALAGLIHQGTNINANGASLLAFYNDGNPANNRDVVLFDGNDSNAQNGSDAPGWNVGLNDLRYTTGKANIQLHVTDGQAYLDQAVYVNGQTLAAGGAVFQGNSVRAANNGPINNGNLWDIKTWDVTRWLIASPNALSMTHAKGANSDCVALICAAIDLPAGAAPPTNRPPQLNVGPEFTVNTPTPVIVEALATDEDGDELTGTIATEGLGTRTFKIMPDSRKITSGKLSLSHNFPLGRHQIYFTADDGQARVEGMTILNVVDNTPPVLNLPPNITVSPDHGKNTAVVTYVVTATDDFPGVTVISLPPSGFAFPVGLTTVNATAVDASGNTTKGSFTVTVTDSIPPVINCPTNICRAADPCTNGALVTYTVSATDNAPGVMIHCLPASGSLFPIGSTRVTCVARDCVGNTSSCCFLVTIVDNQPPVINVPTNMIVANDLSQCSALVNYVVTVTDDAPGATLVCRPPSGSVFPDGETAVFCRAVDATGNTASNSFKVTVIDREKPVLNLPADIIVSPARSGSKARSNSKYTTGVTYCVTAADNCCPAVRVVCTPPSGCGFPKGTNTVRCTATDASGNTAVGSFKVIVQDKRPPKIHSVKPSKKKLSGPRHCMIPIIVECIASDDCDGPVTCRIVSITCNDPRPKSSHHKITSHNRCSLLADWNSDGRDRIYFIKIECKDAAGNTSYETTTVEAPFGAFQ